jgi:hypothetical protein
MQRGRLKSRPFSFAESGANPARAFISRLGNKYPGTPNVPEQLKSPFVVGAGNDAKNHVRRIQCLTAL